MISFVIPAYNAEKTIDRAINSILNQKNTRLDYEIIVVNDGSKDQIGLVMKKYESISNIKYYEKQNTGVASTRNYGVDKAQGDYIIFVDCDDYVDESLLSDIEPYIDENIELIKWNPIFVDNNKNELSRNKNVEFTSVTGEQGFNLLFGKDPLLDCLWNYAIKKDIVLKFPEGTFHEDFAVMPLIILKAQTMVALNKYEYYYVQSENSIMRNDDNKRKIKKLKDILLHYDNLIYSIDNMSVNKITRQNFKIFLTNSLLVIMPELNKENKIYFKNELKKRKIIKNIKIRNLKQLIKRILLEIKY